MVVDSFWKTDNERKKKMNTIYVVGLGPGDVDQMPLAVYRLLKKGEYTTYVRTLEHPVFDQLKEEGIDLSEHSFDGVYNSLDEQFDQVYPAIVEALKEAAKKENIIYAVPGHPMVAEKTVQLLLEQTEIPVEIVGGKSFIDDLFAAVKVDPVDGFQLVDAFDLQSNALDLGNPLVIMQVFNAFIASEVKLSLMEKYPDEHPIALVDAAGTKEETVQWIPLYELDRMEGVYNLLSVFVPPLSRDERMRSFETLEYYTEVLFSNEGDQWAKSQTHESLLPYLQEETQEVIDAVDKNDSDNLAEELGDILLQVMYHSAIGKKQGYFVLDDVLEKVNQKIRRRHPHVFDGEKAETIKDIEAIWQRVKDEENQLDD